jgi:hypothetical protein
MIGYVLTDPLHAHIEIEQQRAFAVVANHALKPEKRAGADAPRHRLT